MADFSPITARRREIYIPEENQAFVDAQNAPPSAYRADEDGRGSPRL